MLTYEVLIEQARMRNMPSTKMRGILREYLQVLVLKEITRAKMGKRLFFTGGTYLRLIHDLKRFSEDLDFNSERIKKSEFEDLVDIVRIGLKRSNIDFQPRFKHWKNIFCADLVFPEVEESYGVVSRYSKKPGIVIKVETNKPKWKVQKETRVVSGFGEFYPCVCTDRGALFADKIDALEKKSRARHLYDVLFMLSNQWPLDKGVLSALGIKDDPLKMIAKRVAGFSGSELKNQAESLRPFLFDEEEAQLIVNAHDVIPALLEKYRLK